MLHTSTVSRRTVRVLAALLVSLLVVGGATAVPAPAHADGCVSTVCPH